MQGETPAAAVTRAKAIGAKRAAATQADANDLVAIATAFPTHAVIQCVVGYVMAGIAACGKTEAVHKLITAGGHRVAVAALDSSSRNARVLNKACEVLYHIARDGGADAKAAIRAVDGVMDKLRQASDVIRAAGEYDYAAKVLARLG